MKRFHDKRFDPEAKLPNHTFLQKKNQDHQCKEPLFDKVVPITAKYPQRHLLAPQELCMSQKALLFERAQPSQTDAGGSVHAYLFHKNQPLI